MPTLLPLAVLVIFATVVWRMWRQRDRVADEVASRFAEERGLEPTAVASPRTRARLLHQHLLRVAGTGLILTVFIGVSTSGGAREPALVVAVCLLPLVIGVASAVVDLLPERRLRRAASGVRTARLDPVRWSDVLPARWRRAAIATVVISQGLVLVLAAVQPLTPPGLIAVPLLTALGCALATRAVLTRPALSGDRSELVIDDALRARAAVRSTAACFWLPLVLGIAPIQLTTGTVGPGVVPAAVVCATLCGFGLVLVVLAHRAPLETYLGSPQPAVSEVGSSR